MGSDVPNPAVMMHNGAPPFIPNPLYFSWHQYDQAIFLVIVWSFTESVMLVATSKDTWEILATSFSSQSTARMMLI
jgi:hypothetical protein